jgi:hypothetical protein
MRVVAENPILLSMTVLIGASAFFVGNAYQAQMPGFALDLGHGRGDFSYSVLLAADGAGGLAAGLILESRGLRTFSGLSVGLLGSLIGIHNSLSYSAAALFLVFAVIFLMRHVRQRPEA